MKQLILTFMAGVMLATSTFAMSPALDADGWKDYTEMESLVINEDTILIAADAISDWDYFWGTTMNPQNTGWNDFWFQCNNPESSVGDCLGTIIIGTTIAALAPVVITGVTIGVIGTIPMTGTVIGTVGFPTTSLIRGALGSI